MSEESRAARAETKAAKAREKALRPWYRKKRYIGGIVLVVIIAAAAAGGGGDSGDDVATSDSSTDEPTATTQPGIDTNSGNTDNPPQADVTVSDCGVDETLGWMQATVTVTNNSSKRSNYSIEMKFESPDGTQQFDSGVAFVNNLDPGQSTSEEVITATDAPDTPFECNLANVERFAS